MSEAILSFRDLHVYQAAFDLQQRIFKATKRFPKEETYSPTDQFRRASRSVGANIAEAWQKRRYSAHFVSKLSDADGEQEPVGHPAADEHRRVVVQGTVEPDGDVLAGPPATIRNVCASERTNWPKNASNRPISALGCSTGGSMPTLGSPPANRREMSCIRNIIASSRRKTNLSRNRIRAVQDATSKIKRVMVNCSRSVPMLARAAETSWATSTAPTLVFAASYSGNEPTAWRLPASSTCPRYSPPMRKR